MRSLKARLAALLKDLEAEGMGEEGEEEEAVGGTGQMKLQACMEEGGWQHHLPRCVKVTLTSNPLHLFTYQFPDQTEEVRGVLVGGVRVRGEGSPRCRSCVET